MIDYALSPQQLSVICALSSGASVLDAAEEAGIHRNTIANWRRNLPPFQFAFAHAQYDRALYFREKVMASVDQAFQTITDLLTDPKTPASVRLKAALAVIQLVVTPPEPKKEVMLDIEKISYKKVQPEPLPQTNALQPDKKSEIVHNPAQPTPGMSSVGTSSPLPANSPQSVHKNAQTPVSREAPRKGRKVGRNESCPCGSGQKFKRCCWNKPSAVAA